jgi:hypothetical protein
MRRFDRHDAAGLFGQLWSLSKLASVRDLQLIEQRVLA